MAIIIIMEKIYTLEIVIPFDKKISVHSLFA